MVKTVSRKLVGQLAEMIFEGGAQKVTKFLSPKLVVKVTRHGKKDNRAHSQNMVLTIGAPNYAERKFIRQCKLAGEPFPVKKPLIKWPTDRRRRKDRKAA
jgi:hypothetical protein